MSDKLGSKRSCLRDSVTELGRQQNMTDRQIEKALDVAVTAWKGNVQAGDAAKIGVDVVREQS